MKIAIYLTFNGNCKEAMNYYGEIFQADIAWQKTYSDSPEKSPEDMKDLIMHTELPVTDGLSLMGCDFHSGKHKEGYVVGNNVEIVLTPKTKADADRVFDALSHGGAVGMPLQDMFWGSYFGTCKDKFGVKWMIDFPCSASVEQGSEEKNHVADGANADSPVIQDDRATKKLKMETRG
jgi:PhnB protein